MRAWLYQMTRRSGWSPTDYRKQVHDGDEIRDWWHIGEKPRRGNLGDIRCGDAVVLFFAKGSNPKIEEVGIYGWGRITKYDSKSGRIRFRALSPSDDLKSCPAWNEQIENLTKGVRGGSWRATMFAIKPETFKELRTHVIRHAEYLNTARHAERKSARRVVARLEKEIRTLPEGFYDSVKFTSTGNCYTHPITLAILCKILSSLPGVRHVAIDLHLKNRRGKMQPDVAAMASIDPPQPILMVDYESPDSCDLRVVWKDVGAYNEWSRGHRIRVPYLIMTTLPNAKAEWRLPWTAKGYVNRQFRKKKSEIFKNPYKFWYRLFCRELKGKNLDRIHFVNIDGKRVMQDALRERAATRGGVRGSVPRRA